MLRQRLRESEIRRELSVRIAGKNRYEFESVEGIQVSVLLLERARRT